MAIIKTRFGTVDAAALEALCDDFDVDRIHNAIEELETMQLRLGSLCEELRDLYDMTTGLMAEEPEDQGPSSEDCEPGQEIWSIAEALSVSISDWSEQIDGVQDILEELEALAPDPDEELLGDDE